MATHSIILTDLEDQALTWKAKQLDKTEDQLIDDFFKGTTLAAWIREMLDEDSSQIRAKWDLLTQMQKDQIKKIAGIKEEI